MRLLKGLVLLAVGANCGGTGENTPAVASPSSSLPSSQRQSSISEDPLPEKTLDPIAQGDTCQNTTPSDSPEILDLAEDLDGDGRAEVIALSCERRYHSFLGGCGQRRLWVGTVSHSEAWMTDTAKIQVIDLKDSEGRKKILYQSYDWGYGSSRDQAHVMIAQYSSRGLEVVWELHSNYAIPSEGVEVVALNEQGWEVKEVACREKRQPKKQCEEQEYEDDLYWTDSKALHTLTNYSWNGQSVVTKSKKRRAPWDQCSCL